MDGALSRGTRRNVHPEGKPSATADMAGYWRSLSVRVGKFGDIVFIFFWDDDSDIV